MSKLLTTTPQEDGFYLPAEASNHLQTWMIYHIWKIIDRKMLDCTPFSKY